MTERTNDEPGDLGVRDNDAEHRYELAVGGHTVVLLYARGPGAIELIHTEVPPALRGRGLANVIAKAALDSARAAGERVTATCPFVRAYLRRHPDYRGLVR